MSVISSFGLIRVAVPEPCIFFWIPASIAEAEAVIPNEAKIFFVNGTTTFINGFSILLNNASENPPDYIILDIWVLDSFMSVDILFSNGFVSLVFYLIVNDNTA